MNKNFLNNQNYILGKAEKKKLLSKFFVEKNYNELRKSYALTKLNIFLFLGFWILLNFFKGNIFIFILEGYFMYSFIFSLLLKLFGNNFGFIEKGNSFTKKGSSFIEDIKNFIFLKEKAFIKILLIYFFIFISIFFISLNILNKPIYLLAFIPYIVFIYINNKHNNKILMNFLSKIRYLNLLQLPIILIYFGLSFLINFSKNIKNYYFIKYLPNSKFLTKFKKLEKNYAENKYYRLEIKK